ncbi:putative quinol monooxygenase [Sinomonas terrae]|uniref:Antibiotic biosynthesis monooxygenase n=1 Tax=Sinomonas terrae TaxID=2908838 RepID=A0ABS9U700_9MICC|nr:antibiotic biosynthesis monooxygenase [Sinomonas terrae]MCH6472479.1 antibiotic biosynthesis monooxygenase [Sinomonas terrae]
MTEIHITGQLVCSTEEEARVVRLHLPDHVRLTRAEVGCTSFEVIPTDDPLVWSVEERFEDQDVFDSHQQRVVSSEWGRATAGVERRYSIEGLIR